MRLSLAAATFAAGLAIGTAATAATIIADIELEFFDSGAGFDTLNGNVPLAGPYGGSEAANDYPRNLPDTAFARDGNADTFVSLPTGSYLTLGFSGGRFVFDGTGDDLFISEPGTGTEFADVFVSSDGTGAGGFILLGQARGDSTTRLDLADIGFVGPVRAIKIVGLDSLGDSPGFDVAYVEGLEGSINVIPLPAGLPLLAGGVVALALLRRRR